MEDLPDVQGEGGVSVSTDGQICFGVMLGEEGDVELPWIDDAETWDNDPEEWWTKEVLGFKHSFEVFDERGEYLKGFTRKDPRVDKYFDEEFQFKKTAPKMPFELVNCCSGDYPMWILAIPSTTMSASRGYPVKFDPAKLVVNPIELSQLLEFCEKYGIEYDGDPKWWLSSYYG